MSVPDIWAGPFDRLDIVARAHAELGQAVFNIFAVFGKMCMQSNTVGAGQMGGFTHQVHADRKRRTGGEGDPPHCIAVWIVKSFNDALAIDQDCRFSLGEAVRW